MPKQEIEKAKPMAARNSQGSELNLLSSHLPKKRAATIGPTIQALTEVKISMAGFHQASLRRNIGVSPALPDEKTDKLLKALSFKILGVREPPSFKLSILYF